MKKEWVITGIIIALTIMGLIGGELWYLKLTYRSYSYSYSVSLLNTNNTYVKIIIPAPTNWDTIINDSTVLKGTPVLKTSSIDGYPAISIETWSDTIVKFERTESQYIDISMDWCLNRENFTYTTMIYSEFDANITHPSLDAYFLVECSSFGTNYTFGLVLNGANLNGGWEWIRTQGVLSD